MQPQLKLLLETLRPNPAYISSRTLDLLATNPGALALYPGIGDWPAAQRNIARFLFLHPAARAIYADWDPQVRGCVARLRALAGSPSASRACSWKTPPVSASASTWPGPAPPTTTP